MPSLFYNYLFLYFLVFHVGVGKLSYGKLKFFISYNLSNIVLHLEAKWEVPMYIGHKI